MTITTTYLVGDDEPYDETIRRFFWDKWVKASTNDVRPIMASPHGQNGDKAKTSEAISSNSWMAHINKDYIRFKQTGTVRSTDKSGGPGVVRQISTIKIDIFAETPYRQFLFEKQMNDILHDNLANNSTRIKKSNGTEDSAIATFDRSKIEWGDVGEFKDAGIVRQSFGELGVVWSQIKS